MEEEYDYILVGSGVAAATLAGELLEREPSTRILILEAGSKIHRQNRRHWWDYAIYSVFDPLFDISNNNDKYLPYSWSYDQEGEYEQSGTGWYFGDYRNIAYGGSTMHWGGWSLRFKPEDFQMYSLTGLGSDWPISYGELEKYYCKAEEYLSVGGDNAEDWGTPDFPMPPSRYSLPPFPWSAPEAAMAEAFKANGLVPGHMPISRYRKCLTTGTCKYCPLGSRFSADQVLDEMVADPRHTGLRIKWNSPATSVLCESKRRVRAVRYLDGANGLEREARAKTIVVCAGTFESPKLLLMSRNPDWKEGIGNDHDCVGRYLVSHSQLKVRGTKKGNAEKWFQEYDFPTLMSRTWDSPEHQANGKIFLYNNRKLPNFDFAAKMIAGKSRVDIEAEFTSERSTQLEAFYEDKGQWGNRVLCDPVRRTRFGLPRTVVHFSRETEADAAITRWLALMKGIVESMGYTVSDAVLKPELPGGHHASGTCRMGMDPLTSVTDENLKVHGVENLYVCSNAVFPTSSAVNPTLTLVALAFRLSEHLMRDAPQPFSERLS